MANCDTCFSMTRLRFAHPRYGHAMSFFGLIAIFGGEGTGKQTAPFSGIAQGRSLPISRGSPPL